MNVAGVEHPDDERPDFLRVEAPVASPRVVGPDGPCDEGERPEDEPDDREAVGERLEGIGRGQRAQEARTGLRGGGVCGGGCLGIRLLRSARFLRGDGKTLAPSLQELGHRQCEGEREKRRRERGHEHVNDEPHTLERVGEGHDGGVEPDRGAAEQDRHEAGDEGPEEPQVVLEEHDEVDRDDEHRSGERELVHVRPRHAPRGDAARDVGADVEEEAEYRQRGADAGPHVPRSRGGARFDGLQSGCLLRTQLRDRDHITAGTGCRGTRPDESARRRGSPRLGILGLGGEVGATRKVHRVRDEREGVDRDGRPDQQDRDGIEREIGVGHGVQSTRGVSSGGGVLAVEGCLVRALQLGHGDRDGGVLAARKACVFELHGRS